MTRILAATSLLALAACAEYDARLEADVDGVGDAYLADPVLRIDVYPSYDDYTAEADDGFDLLPHTFDVDVAAVIGVDLVLDQPVFLSGSLTGYRVSPYAFRDAGLPGASEPIPATITLSKEDTIQTRTALSSLAGEFGVEVVPDDAYRMTVVPDDPAFPMYTEEVDLLDDNHVDLDLGAGSALYGLVVRGDGTPREGVEVYAESVFGGRTRPVLTDDEGRYQLRVSPGAYRVVTTGLDDGRDPTVPSDEVFVGEEGRRVDLTYETLDFRSVGGRILVSNGDVLQGGAVARIRAVSIDDYPEDTSLEVEIPADPFGNFDTRLLPGTYDVEVIPTATQQISPVRVEGFVVEGDTDLGSITLPPMSVAFGSISDPEEEWVSGALLDCVEIGFGQRRFSTYSDETGQFGLLASNVPLRCRMVPPGQRTDLAMTSRELNLSQTPSPQLRMEYGQRIAGTVRYNDAGALRPLELAVVEVRDTKGQLLGTAITTGGGSFSVRVTAAD